MIRLTDVGVKYSFNKKRIEFRTAIDNLVLGRNNKKAAKGEFWALKGIGFEGAKGDIIGIIGSNGAGKSTLCKVLSKLLRPDSGEIQVGGEISALLSLGTGFNKGLSGKENIYLNGMMLGFSRRDIDKLYHEIVEFSGLDNSFIEQPIKYYSSGMKARLGFSIASMLAPEILVLDEALSTGDIGFKATAADKMKELVQNAKIVIIVSHDINFIEKNCTKAIWLDGGTIKAFGDAASIANQYRLEASPKKKKKIIADLKKTESKISEEVIINVADVGVRYNLSGKEIWALKDIAFTVKKGEIVGIIGNNGAGKSTLCKVLSKILKQDEGRVEVNGEVAALLSFGIGFNGQLSGADNIYLNGLMLGLTKERIEQVYEDIVSFSGLEKSINRPVKQYSSGMRARLGFSIAATLEPDIFIIDEALSVGDIAFYEKASERIQEMIAASKAVMVVTHSMMFVEKVCTRAIWINKGRLVFDGDPREAVAKYRENTKQGNVN
ncbi:ABC transporter ATP-binding protein [Desulforamulus aquiferis]|uniref:ATP-binding cassette domain-containing protein n=1 Tax=Desulforamulus aquiferis TaxID=1397668 RepID=A0AAW7ZB10_9FIRM|nr:ATP-binding cassette domain-containing protein [Desulforamulus aquiferis]MDO7786859.1 ATP-binding cassette domain-containing protein [Desulforamulus aquiferis]